MSKRHRAERKQPEPADDEGLWIRSDVMPDGTYAVTISFESDHVWVLDRAGTVAYAQTCLDAAQRAEFDAAVFKLFNNMGLDVETTTHVIACDLRPDRPPPNDAATAPLTFVPGVTAKGKPFVHILLDGEPHSQLDPAQLREHAMVVLEAPVAADLDAGLLRALKNMDIPDDVARAAVGEVGNWRTP